MVRHKTRIIKKNGETKNPLEHKDFPLSSKYDYKWLIKDCFGANPLWLTEWLCQDIRLKPGMRVLDLGCGTANSSIFLAKEFGVEVWATDLWVNPTDNYKDISAFGLQDKIFPLKADARKLPFSFEFFDAIISIDAMQYFGTDMLFLPTVIQYLKAGGIIAFASPGMTKEFSREIPEHLKPMWTSDFWCLRTSDWWHEHWHRTGLVDIELSATMADGWKLWTKWAQVGNSTDWYLKAIREDAGTHLGYIKTIAKKNENAPNLAYDLQTGEWM
jgi:cyclopropane fatty-acyl-phospholipid synthase-like methyltransferase